MRFSTTRLLLKAPGRKCRSLRRAQIEELSKKSIDRGFKTVPMAMEADDFGTRRGSTNGPRFEKTTLR